MIADVVNVTAPFVGVGTIAAAITSTTTTEITSDGPVTETINEVIAAESVEITVPVPEETVPEEIGTAQPVMLTPVLSTAPVFVGEYFSPAVIQIGNGRFDVRSEEIDSSGVHAKNVSLTALEQGVEFSQITGGGSLVESTFNGFDNDSYSEIIDLEVKAADSVEITAGYVNANGGLFLPNDFELRGPNVVAKQVDIDVNSLGSLAVAGGFTARSENTDLFEFDEDSGLPLSSEYRVENSASIRAASDVAINVEGAPDMGGTGGTGGTGDIQISYERESDNLQVSANSFTLTGKAQLESVFVTGDVDLVDLDEELLVSVNQEENFASFEYDYVQSTEIAGADEVNLEGQSFESITAIADEVIVSAENVGTLTATGSVKFSTSGSGSYSEYAYDYSVYWDEVLPESQVSMDEQPPLPYDNTGADEQTIGASASVKATISGEGSTSVTLFAETVEITTEGSLELSSGGISKYGINGEASRTESFTNSFAGGFEGEFENSFNSNFYVNAAESVALEAAGSISGAVAASELFAEADHFDEFYVDGGQEASFTDTGVKKLDSDEGSTVFAADLIEIKATGSIDSYIEVLAINGSITTAGATGDYVEIVNAVGEAQNIEINLGGGNDDTVNFTGLEVEGEEFAIESVAVEVDDQDGQKVVTLKIGVDTYTLTDVEVYEFNNQPYFLDGTTLMIAQTDF